MKIILKLLLIPFIILSCSSDDSQDDLDLSSKSKFELVFKNEKYTYNNDGTLVFLKEFVNNTYEYRIDAALLGSKESNYYGSLISFSFNEKQLKVGETYFLSSDSNSFISFNEEGFYYIETCQKSNCSTVTITNISGNRISGKFKFNAYKVLNSGEKETVNGTFSNLIENE